MLEIKHHQPNHRWRINETQPYPSAARRMLDEGRLTRNHMLKQKGVQTLLCSAVVVLVIYLLGSVISLNTQKPIDQPDAKPLALPDVEITVVNKTTANAQPKTVVSDTEGKFDFGVLSAGTYEMTLRQRSRDPLRDKEALTKQSRTGSPADPTLIKVTIDGTVDGAIVRGWDPKTKKPVALSGTTSKIGDERIKMAEKTSTEKPPMRQEQKTAANIVFTIDGKQRLKGSVHDISMASIRNLK
jgi:hypothetical protein